MSKLFQIRNLEETYRSGLEREYRYDCFINGERHGRWYIETFGPVTLGDLRNEIQYMKNIDDSFKCLDCGVHTGDTGEYYTVEDEIWLAANPDDHGMLCVGCLETRIGRALTPADFPEYPVNMVLEQKSPRLRDRISG